MPSEIKPHYQVVVIGSGYGGSIAASRMARSGLKVCLLERGKEFRPGEFPNTEFEAAREISITLPELTIGSSSGLYNLHVDEDINVLTGCGLGGTSLINANVAIKAEPRVFECTCWPKQIRNDIHTLIEEGYTRAQEMLMPRSYPDSYPALAKAKALEKSALDMGYPFYKPELTVTFEAFKDGINHVGMNQEPCVCCGDCVSGCNYAAKNTLAMNYLPDAFNFGAEIFTQVSVSHIAQKDKQYEVYYNLLHEGRESLHTQETFFVTADIVIVSAGSLGSTEILMRSKAFGLPLSNQIGNHFTGNGDAVAFSYNTETEINGVGFGFLDPQHMEPVGPCITSIIDMRNQPVLEDGMVIEEGNLPSPLANLLPLNLAKIAKEFGEPLSLHKEDRMKEKEREFVSLVCGARTGAVRNTQTYLVMAHDDANGQMYLDDKHNRLRVRWKGVGKQAVFETVNKNLKKASESLGGGQYVINPIWSKYFDKDLITVHPLGGCIMADSAEQGAVNHKGQLFSGTEGDDVHEGLYVCDGSIIPRSLGVNPLLTIASLAERTCYLVAEDRNLQIDYGFPSHPPATKKNHATMGLSFIETMKGYFTNKVVDDYHKGYQIGKQHNSPFLFNITIQTENLEELLESREHQANITGIVEAPVLSEKPLTVHSGTFNLLVDDPSSPDSKEMWYRLCMNSVEGQAYFMEGFKQIRHDSKLDIWADTTTLYISVYDGEDNTAPLLGRGILMMEKEDFMKQLATIRIINETNKIEKMKAIARFGTFFAGSLYETYGSIFAKEHVFNPTAPPRKKRSLRTGAPEIHYFVTEDGVELRLSRYHGGNKGPILLIHGFGVSSIIFSLDTIETNLLEYLYAHGYDVWLLDWRASIELPFHHCQFTLDDAAQFDYPAAISKIRSVAEVESVDVLAHCVGAATFTMSMLSGLQGIRSIILSQIGGHFKPPLLNRIKVGLHIPTLLSTLGIDSLQAYSDSEDDWYNVVYNQALKLYPLPLEERCHSPVCRRATFMYGLLFEHEQLNDLTHDCLHEMLGGANITAFEQVALVFREGKLLRHDGADVYMKHLDRLAIPITFIHGAENQVNTPEGTERTYHELCARNGSSLYNHHIIPEYGHIDCLFGKNAIHDVYPYILEHLTSVNKKAERLQDN
ncbi:GMC family oxidoreductase N-terminal domain-containing protein [Brevibacillus laterosporus]|uniref:GMC family oxidoreductase N-terminal domain-containing protein n=1 Tax=Brevibacillus laterosporus TaxID=1465 RepID=UPI001DBE4617|nr:GMC family oxidoreductase N-terminal domain-containing protein [Brevibacillus laterosporus]MBM7107785.1 Cholesterol oxidase [Brevibacillus laterosporus]WNX29316.1 GMC family oxidoreductase N-terminal domain-containing protein [Brevibacillus laterosporus]